MNAKTIRPKKLHDFNEEKNCRNFSTHLSYFKVKTMQLSQDRARHSKAYLESKNGRQSEPHLNELRMCGIVNESFDCVYRDMYSFAKRKRKDKIERKKTHKDDIRKQHK